ncbi:MAG TPA: DHA2 family efflux MFS transporter permease subunit [Capillimicrobium sp.]|jgi:EmrB/QacA subfamily drug resistance transporter
MSPRQARLTVVAAILGSIVVFIDSTVVNVALPAIREDLGGGLAGQQWLNDAYLLTLGALLLIGGSLGDLHGRRRLFSIGLAGFGVTSVLCALAPTLETLIVARGLQGLAGALLVPNTLGLIVAKFPPNERGAAIGTWTAWTGIAMIAGPLVGGLLLDIASWRWIFAINVVPVAVALRVIAQVDAEHDTPTAGRVDLVGAVLGTVGLGLPVLALIEQPLRGWSDPLVLGGLAGGAALLALFVAYERRASHPMLPLELFRERNFAVGNAATLAVYGGLGAGPFLLVIFLQQVAGYSPLEAGSATIPVTVLMFLLSKRFGALADRIGPRFFMAAGPIVGGIGFALLARIDASGDYVADVLPGVLVFGLGLSLTVAPLTATVLGGVAERHAGMGSAINNAVARIGGLLAVAAIGAVVGIEELDASAVGAFQRAMIVTGALVALGGVLAALGIENPRRAVPCEECEPAGSAAAIAPPPTAPAAGSSRA